ncbi:phage tail protein [Thauera propionica]|uniref:phage tail protein n=1 Tax=Thauera propionica TaxID=2019431 RepID=UPI0023F0DD91|nr:phage tail protein [Thauera propionica]MDD3676028.1 phage tail protein [Thauera propionica]
MAERVMLALGPFRFEVGSATYQSLAMSQSWRWPEQARIGRDSALQFTGRDPAEIRLHGVLFPGFDAGLAQVDAMRQLADRGEPMQLVDGLGRVWGSWVIAEVSDTRSVLMDNGQPRRVGFEVRLKPYGEDDTATNYSGSWSPFAMLRITDAVLADPVGAIGDLLSSLPWLIDDSSSSSDVSRTSSIYEALQKLLSTFSASLNGLHSKMLSAGLTIDEFDPLVQQVITATNAPLGSSSALNTQITALLTAISALWTAAAAIQSRADPARSEIASELAALLEKTYTALVQLQESLP